MMNSNMHSAAQRTRQALAGIALLALLLSGAPAASVHADDAVQQVEIPKTGMQSGQLTGKSDSSAEIGGRGYAFHKKVVFASEEGSPLEWNAFKKGDRVQYHLKGERIDFLILILPQ